LYIYKVGVTDEELATVREEEELMKHKGKDKGEGEENLTEEDEDEEEEEEEEEESEAIDLSEEELKLPKGPDHLFTEFQPDKGSTLVSALRRS
jgi:hypothetical protein